MQNSIGWQQFFEGWISVSWKKAQQSCYSLIHSHHTGYRWITSLIKKLWNVAWNLWEHCNDILHNKDSIVTSIEHQHLNQRVQSMILSTTQPSYSGPRYLLEISIIGNPYEERYNLLKHMADLPFVVIHSAAGGDWQLLQRVTLKHMH